MAIVYLVAAEVSRAGAFTNVGIRPGNVWRQPLSIQNIPMYILLLEDRRPGNIIDGQFLSLVVEG